MFTLLTLQKLARAEGLALLAGLFAITLWKLIQTGQLAGLMRDSDGTVSPGRIQLLTLTMATAMQLLLTVIHDPSRLPAVPDALVEALGGSQLVFLGAKAWGQFADKGKRS